jgi:TPR repeat protein
MIAPDDGMNRNLRAPPQRNLPLLGKLLLILVLGAAALCLQVTTWILESKIQSVRLVKNKASVVVPKSIHGTNGKANGKNSNSKTIQDSSPQSPAALHSTRQQRHSSSSPLPKKQVYWDRAVSTLLANWDPTVRDQLFLDATTASSSGSSTFHTNTLAPTATAVSQRRIGNQSSMVFGIKALEKAAALGHADAQFYMANAYASGLWPVSNQQLVDTTAINDNDASLPKLNVQGDWSKNNPQQNQALLLWHMAAIGGNPEAAMALANRLGSFKKTSNNNHYCWDTLPFYQAAANHIVDTLESDSQSRAKILPHMDKHTLYHVHMHGGTGLDANNQPHETQEALDFYRARATTPHAAYSLAQLYQYGARGAPQNLTLALKLYEQAARHGHWEAAGQAGLFRFWGIGCRADPFAAHKLVQLGLPYDVNGCRRKHEEKLKQAKNITEEVYVCDHNALNGMGLLLLFGLPMIVGVDAESAAAYFQLAKEQGNKDASYNLAMMKLGWKTHFKSIHDMAADAGHQGQSFSNDHSQFPLTDDQMAKHGPTHGEMQSLLTDLATAASNGHLQAKHRLAMMYAAGVRMPNKGTTVQVVPKDCDKAAKNFKWIIDHASPHLSKRLRKAYEQYTSGDWAGSLRNYLIAAESGSDLAQLNAAFLLERGECLGMARMDCAKASARLWKAAADKGNAEASLRVGDFYYYGRFRDGPEGVVGPFGWLQYIIFPEKHLAGLIHQGWHWFYTSFDKPGGSVRADKRTATAEHICIAEDEEGTCVASNSQSNSDDDHTLQKDLEMAAHYYRMATGRASSPRANYNLGFMYEWGLGLKQDFPLAKRHYDLAVSVGSQEAQLPVAIALVCMNVHEYLVKLWMSRGDWLLETQFGRAFAPFWSAAERSGRLTDLQDDLSSENFSRPRPGRTTKTDVILAHLLSWESALILVLTLVLSSLFSYRRRTQMRR